MTVKRDRRKEWLQEIIFEADTKAGRWFDIGLLVSILLSVLVVLLESVESYHAKFGTLFLVIEWVLTIIFTLEYMLRLYVVYRPMKYATSFYGIIDLLSIIPTYIGIFIAGTHSLIVIRALRLLRVFRILKLANHLDQGRMITDAVKRSLPKISVFLFFILVLVTIFGSIMYLVEGDSNPSFDSIPRSIYWAIVTLTTVGYGDITPRTEIGQMISAVVMLLGYAIIAVPTGIVSSEITRADYTSTSLNTQACRYCADDEHSDDAIYCKTCGHALNKN